MPESTDDTTTESTNKWTEIAGQLIDRILGKDVSMTCDFRQLTIDLPKAEGPGGMHMGSVQWTINGKITITCEAYEKTRMRNDV
ncbi:MAG: hypothetical protein WBZ36_02915 [Candidatus Nitrosopolaris sp.]